MPSIDVNPAMDAKILMESGQVLHRSTYRPLTQDDLLDKDGSDAQEQSWPESIKSWGPEFYLESCRTYGWGIPHSVIYVRMGHKMSRHFPG